jgi:hypothetical protein
MQSPSGIIKIRGDREAGVFMLEKLQALTIAHEATAGPRGQDSAPPSSRQHGSSSAPRVQPSDIESISIKTIQIEADAAQITRIMRDLDNKYELAPVAFLWANVDMFAWQLSQMPSRSLRSSLLSSKTSFVMKSKSCSMPASSRRSTSRGG